ncbi:hypothetical protein WQ56_01015 [Luteimonas sp. FCS-9]|nr:hypothetical protein WQ56_01015 [Luteimonas sp. FCS-9]
MALGAAASVAVAVGIAWQLRPAPETTHAPWSEAEMATRASAPMPAAEAPAPVDPPARARRVDATAEPDAPAAATTAAAPPDTTRAAVEAAPTDLRMPPERHAPGWGAAPESDAGATAFGSRVATAGPASSRADEAAEADRAASAQPQGIALIEDVPDDDQPPASADAPEVRDAWLARVRELLDAGDIGAARASLAEFHRRHPDADLPPDLRALLD